MEADPDQVERRTFLRKAAITGLATAWAIPIVQTVAVPSAFARGNESPPPGDSEDKDSNDSSHDNSGGESDDNSDGD